MKKSFNSYLLLKDFFYFLLKEKGYMLTTFLLGVKVFSFIFAILIVIRDAYNFVKVIRLREGKYDATTTNLIVLASSISYILTMLIIGF